MTKKYIALTILFAILLVIWFICTANYISEFRQQFNSAFLVGGIVVLSLAIVYGAISCYYMHREKLKVENTIREQAEEASQKREILDYVLSHSNAYTWRVKGNYVFMSRTLSAKLESDSRKARIGTNLEGLTDDDRLKMIDFLNNNTPGDYHLQIFGDLLKMGNHWYELHLHIHNTKNGIEKHGVTVLIDYLKEQEHMSLEAHRRLMNAEQREHFIAMMNHEIRTPLNSILGFSQMLSTPELSLPEEEIKQIGDTITQNGESLLKLIGNILLLTHMDNSNVNIQWVESNVAENICEGCVLYEIQRKQKNIKVVIEKGPAEAWVRIDHQFMVTIVDNLCSNAIKFMKQNGTLYLGWRVEGDEVIVYVRDEGIGISPEHHKRIFERFFKVDSFTPGVGLGLSVAEEFAKRIGARIEVESELGKGSTFNIILKKIK